MIHKNVQMFKKCFLNYELQNIEYQVGSGFSPAEFIWEIL
jgi:hypothetical protein